MTELEPLGAVLGRLLPSGGGTVEYCLNEVWSSCVGADIAQNAQPLSLRKGRLVVATSSPAWAHALQLMEDQIVDRLNRALEVSVRGRGFRAHAEPICRVQFRAAGWAGASAAGGAARAGGSMGGDVTAGATADLEGAGNPRPAAEGRSRALPPELEAEVRAVQLSACDATLGDRVAAAMRAWLGRNRHDDS